MSKFSNHNVIGNYSSPFKGIFDGNGFAIRNLTCTISEPRDYTGLFGMAHQAVIRNVCLEDVLISSAGSKVGGLAGFVLSGSVTNCSAEGIVSGVNEVGGLIGRIDQGSLDSCYSISDVSGNTAIGGLAGFIISGTVRKCYAAANVTGTAESGGLIGSSQGGSTLQGSTVQDCYATGAVSVNSAFAGGLCGRSFNTQVSNCYSTVAVSGGEAGGLIGYVSGSTFIACFWDTQTSGLAFAFGVGQAAGVTGKTTAEMKTVSTFTAAGWDFASDDCDAANWVMPEGEYPALSDDTAFTCRYDGGTGDGRDPYLIRTAEQLNAIGLYPEDWDKAFMLTAEIDMSAYTGGQYNVIGTEALPFTGTFDGSGHVIRNLTYIQTIYEIRKGLIGYAVDATISRVGLENVVISSASPATGGLVGRADDCTITRCFVTGTVSGTTRIGGLIGYSYNSYVDNCYTQVAVTASLTSAGGLIGETSGTVSKCYSTGTVACSTYAGGLIGYRTSQFLSGCFWDTETSGTTIGVGYGSATGATGKTTAQMQTQSTFTEANWDFIGQDADWRMIANDYPRLIWEPLYGGGTGTDLDPYLISAPEHLMNIGLNPAHWNKHFRLAADIDMSAYTGAQYKIIGSSQAAPFTGTFDGNGRKITNLSYTITTDTPYLGMFGYLNGAAIHDVGLVNVGFSSNGNYVGGLAGFASEGSTIQRCYVTGSIQAHQYVGGLIGYKYGSVSNCYSSVSVSGSNAIGGLVGFDYGAVSNCYSAGPVNGLQSAGGFFGGWREGPVTNCFWDTQTSGRSNGVGSGNINGLYGKTTQLMMQSTTFTQFDWDFSDTDGDPADWMMLRAGEDYPRLAWQEIYAGDIAGLYGVDLADVMELAAHWLDCSVGSFRADIDGNGRADMADFAAIAADWMME